MSKRKKKHKRKIEQEIKLLKMEKQRKIEEFHIETRMIDKNSSRTGWKNKLSSFFWYFCFAVSITYITYVSTATINSKTPYFWIQP